MSKQEERDRLEQPVANLEVFEGAITKAAQDLTERMGRLATEGVSEQDLEWMTRVSDVAEKIMGPLERLFQAINDAPYEATVIEEESDDAKDGLDTGEEQDIPADMNGTKEAFTIPEGLSEDESERLAKAFDLLSIRAQNPERGSLHIRRIVESVFGTRTIPKSDFTKFVENLNKIAKRRGPWYFIEPNGASDSIEPKAEPEAPKQDSDSKGITEDIGNIAQSDSSIGVELSESDQLPEAEEGITLVLNDRERKIWDQILTGGSTVEWFGQCDLDLAPLEFVSNSAKNTAFSLFTKKALEAGILIDNGKTRGARRYKIASGVETVSTDLSNGEIEKEEGGQSITEPPRTEPSDRPQPSQEISFEGLNEREQRILNCIINSVGDAEWFRQSEVDLSSVGSSSESALRKAFGRLTSKAVELGVLMDNGKAGGGKKYRVIKDNRRPVSEPTSSESTKVAEPLGAKSEKRAKPLIKANGGPTSPPIPFYDALRAKTQEVTDTQDDSLKPSERDRLRSERLAESVGRYISATHLTEKKNGTPRSEKVATIAKDIAQRMGIEVEEARELVKNLVEGGKFYINGHIKGSPLLSTEAPEINELDGHQLTPGEVETKRDQERQRIVELRTIYEKGILVFLSGLTKEQTEFKTAIASALGDYVSADDVNEICNLLRADGLLEPKREAGRGSRRTRKGKTWKITGAGRRKLNEINSQLTNKEKKELGKGLSTARQS